MGRSHQSAFDYIVVGAGTSGCIIASRLAEAGASVLLLEAGGRYPRRLDLPLVSLWTWLRHPDRYCWQDQTEPQPALDGRRLAWPAGRLVGGSSAINAMIYCRGHRGSYDRWHTLPHDVTNPQWTYDDLLPYFRRAENFEGGASTDHGADGPVGVSASRYPNALADSFIQGCEQLGIVRTEDFNSAGGVGVGYLHLTQRNGRRTSSASYLRDPTSVRVPMVHLHATVRRVVIERGRATGVDVDIDGRRQFHRATGEVILCTGTVRSPQLLMLSGIGPARALRQLGITVEADRPGVGMNLRDHVRVPVAHLMNRPRPTRFSALPLAAWHYATGRRGLLASNVADAAAIVRLDPTQAVPDLRIVCRWRVLPENPAWAVDFEVVAIDPASSGQLSLVSANGAVPPRIDPAYLSEARDRNVLQRGIELARAIAASKACRAEGLGAELLPGATDAMAHIRSHADTAFHAVGTCRLGGDDDAVVDPWLRVVGVDGLRVVDASVMPTTVAGNAQAAVQAIAERAAAFILGTEITGCDRPIGATPFVAAT